LNKAIIEKGFGREAFGFDPAGYHAARPAYPEWVYEVLCNRCGLRWIFCDGISLGRRRNGFGKSGRSSQTRGLVGHGLERFR